MAVRSFEEFLLMLEIGLLIAAVLGLVSWLLFRRTSALPTARNPHAPPLRDLTGSVADAKVTPALDIARVCAASRSAADRLWKLGFAAPVRRRSSERADQLVRENVLAILRVDTLKQDFFPRRPALLQQLMQAIDDPLAAPDRLSRIVAHDPVLTADVLRLANSGLYRISEAPIETIQRAIVVCGVDALRTMLSAAMLRPAFRATSKNFPRLPRVLWGRTELAARAAELFAMQTSPSDRFESQLAVLLNALGPLVVYGATLDVYLRNPMFPPSPALCAALTVELAPQMAQRVARDWQASARLVAALEKPAGDPLSSAMHVGELIGTLCFLESQTVISIEDRTALIDGAGLHAELINGIWSILTRSDTLLR